MVKDDPVSPVVFIFVLIIVSIPLILSGSFYAFIHTPVTLFSGLFIVLGVSLWIGLKNEKEKLRNKHPLTYHRVFGDGDDEIVEELIDKHSDNEDSG